MTDDPGLRYCQSPAGMLGGNAVRFLRDGREAYPAMLAAIEGAARTVHLETYILRSDRTGRRFGAALAAAARRGVRVRLVYDAVGSFGIDAGLVEELRAAGVSVRAYRPVRLLSLFSEGHRRNHRKLLVADGRIGFAGGLNLGDEYAPVEEGGEGWRDNHLRVEGPAAAEMDHEFLRLWESEKGERAGASVPPRGPGAEEGGVRVRVLVNQSLLHRHRIRTAYLHAIHRAERSIEISNAYFLPDRAIRRALARAASRGVAVTILVPGRSDVPVVACAMRHLYGRLLRTGARLLEYEPGVFHCRTVVVDRLWCALGSYNLDHRSLFHNLEINLHVLDAPLGGVLGAAFEADLARSREVTLGEWRGRSPAESLRDRLCYALRYWL